MMTNKRKSVSSIVVQDLEVLHCLHQPKQYECEGSMIEKQTCLGLLGSEQEHKKIIGKKRASFYIGCDIKSLFDLERYQI